MNLSRDTTLEGYLSEDFDRSASFARHNPGFLVRAEKSLGSHQPSLTRAYTLRLTTRTPTFLTTGAGNSVTPDLQEQQVWCADTREVRQLFF